MSHGYTSVPQDEAESAPPPVSLGDRARSWWARKFGSSDAERAPLLDRNKMTLEPPKKSTRKVILSVIFIIAALIVLGFSLGFWLDDDESSLPPGRPELTEAEKHMLSLPKNDSIRDYLKTYTSEAHLAGSESDKRQAEWTRDKLIEFGIADTTIEEYWPLLNYPVQRRLALVSGPKEFRYEATLREDVVDEDETSKNPDAVPTFHGYSKNGTATGPVVYANYGRVEDFQYLVDQGVNLTGTIALVRYGGAFRGLKVRAAEVFGCAGALIYSDPIDDGPLNKEDYPFTNPPESYPKGPWRSPSSVQRGSVEYLSLSTGDPLTPGWPAKKDAPRLKQDEVEGLAKIPSLPLSWQDALPLLKATQGRGVAGDKDWKGGLDEVDYYSGPTEGDVELVNIVDYKITPIWDVIGVIKGTVEPERTIVLGNHRDAWVFGAVDPSSGSAAMLELARAFGELLKTGWRPARTIVFASWDAEEYGLVGSTEWVEDHAEWLSREGTVYINVDTAVSGPHFQVQASPSLKQLLYDITSEVADPRTGNTVYDAWHEFTNRTDAPAPQPFVGQLGSGSDFVPFLDHLGIASLSMAFSGDYGVYHSNYDSFHWMDTFGDPGFYYHETLVKIWGLMTLRLSDSPLLPIRPNDYADALTEYLGRLSHYGGQPRTFPELDKAVAKLSKVAAKFERRADHLEAKVRHYTSQGQALPGHLAKRVSIANKRLTYFERGFLSEQGIRNRSWFKHVVYAPGLWTGYSSQVFPNMVDAMDAKDAAWLQEAEQHAALSVRKAADWLRAK